MAKRKIIVASCQFAVSPSIERNARTIREFMTRAKKAHAELVHFSECALSGYAGAEHLTLESLDWDLLRRETESIMRLAGKLRLWTILGSTHYLAPRLKPHNSLYLIDPRGHIADRYDKRFCTARDLKHYSPGDHFVIFDLNAVRCALLICFDLRFPELYRALKARGVECIFQSFYNAREKGRTVHTDIMRQTMQCRAGENGVWISMANSSTWYSSYPSCFIQPDGTILRQLHQHRPGMMINTVDTARPFYDPSAPFRTLAFRGELSNGKTPSCQRSKNRKKI
jgi:deaminated glutathione amidase